MSDPVSNVSNQPASSYKAGGRPLWKVFFLMLAALGVLLALYMFRVPKFDTPSLPMQPQPAPVAQQPAPAPLALQALPENETVIALNQQVGRLIQRVDSLDERLNTLSLTETNAANDTISEETKARIETLETRISELQNTIAASREEGTSRARLLIIFDRLEKQVNGGEPFEHSLSAFRLAASSLQGSETLIGKLATYQSEGVSTLTSLQHGLNMAISRYMAQADGGKEGIWSNIKHNLSQLVIIRKVGDSHEGNDTQSRIARAEAALKDGEIELAVEEIDALAEADREQFSDWLDNAKAYLAVQEILDKIEASVSDMMDQKQGKPELSAPNVGE